MAIQNGLGGLKPIDFAGTFYDDEVSLEDNDGEPKSVEKLISGAAATEASFERGMELHLAD